jgi:hypothetical protein
LQRELFLSPSLNKPVPTLIVITAVTITQKILKRSINQLALVNQSHKPCYGSSVKCPPQAHVLGLGCQLMGFWEVIGSWGLWLNQWVDPFMGWKVE